MENKVERNEKDMYEHQLQDEVLELQNIEVAPDLEPFNFSPSLWSFRCGGDISWASWNC